MAITITAIEASGSAQNSKIYSTSAFAANANELLLLVVVGHHTTLGDNIATIVHAASVNPVTFVEVARVNYNTSASVQESMMLFRGMNTAPSNSDTASITWAPNTDSNCVYSLISVAGVNTSGVNGAGAVGSVMTGSTDSGTGLSLVLLSMGAGDASYGAFQIPLSSATGITTGSNYTQIHQFQPSAEAEDLLTEWAQTGNTTVDATWALRAGGGIAIQIIAGQQAAQTIPLSITPLAGGSLFVNLAPIPGGGAPISFRTF